MPTLRNLSPLPYNEAGQPVLRIAGLGKEFYLHEQGKTVPSAKGLSFEVRAGELVALVGPSGAGKSSVLKCIYRTYLPSSGQILYRTEGGRELDLAAAPESEILALREREIGAVTQFLHCLPRQSALDVTARPLIRLGESPSIAREKARQLLSRLGVPVPLHPIAPATFSGGERQRVNIARGVIVPRRLLLLDEPTASLDPAARDRVIGIILEEKQRGAAIVAVFHDLAVAGKLAERTIEIAQPVIPEDISADLNSVIPAKAGIQ